MDEPSCAPSWPEEPSRLAGLERRAGAMPRVRLAGEGNDEGSTDGKAGRYELHGELARGGMGVVLRGRDSDLGREVALKVLREELAQVPEVLQRFVEEAQVGGQLQHPGIVPVYELGVMEGERPFFSMKLIEGRTLAELLRERSGPADGLHRLLDVFEAICQTMAYAHSRGVVHRDLKPANVMVGAFGEVQVVDWGLAKVLGAERGTSPPDRTARDLVETARSASGSGSRSRVGSVLGTPAYMPPEQARGEVEDLDERADVFSLGAILCELLTGAPPYGGETTSTVLQAARGELDEAHARLARSAAHDELSALARACLAPEREGRPGSAREVAERVRAHLDSVEERARSAQLEAAEQRGRAAEEHKARRLTLALSVTVVLALVTGGAGYFYVDAQREERARHLATQVQDELDEAILARGEDRFRAAVAAAERADAISRASDDPDPELRARIDEVLAEVRRDEEDARRAAELSADNAALLASLADVRQPEGQGLYASDWSAVERATKQLFEQRGLDVDAGDPSEVATELAVRDATVSLAAALDEWAQVRAALSDDAGVERLHRIASLLDPDPRRIELRDAIRDADAEPLEELARAADLDDWPPRSLALLGTALRRRGRHEPAIELLQRAVERAPQDFVARMDLARALARATPARDREAAREYRAAMALRPDSVEALHELVQALESDPAERDEARRLLRRALERWPEDAHLRDHLAQTLIGYDASPAQRAEGIALLERARELAPEDTSVLGNLAVAYERAGRLEDALALEQRSVELEPDSSLAHLNLGSTLFALGHFEEAVGGYARAAELDPDLAEAHSGAAACLLELGRVDEAEASLARALELDPELASARYNRGRLLARRGRDEEALAELRRACELAPTHAEWLMDVGSALRRLGRLDEAVEVLERATRLRPDDPGPWNNLGNALRDMDRPVEALAALDRAARLGPDMATVHLSRAVVLGDLEEYDAAIAAFERALELRPDDATTHYSLGVTLHQQRRFEEARDCYERSLELDDDLPQAWINLGYAQRTLGEPEAAIEAFARGLEGLPRMTDPRFRLAALLVDVGDEAWAIEEYARLLELEPEHLEALDGLAWLLATAGDEDLRDPGEAAALAERAVELAPDSGGVWNTLGVARYRAGDLDGALTALDRSMELRGGGDPADWLVAAMARWRQDDEDGAREFYERSLDWLARQAELDPELDDFRREAAELIEGR